MKILEKVNIDLIKILESYEIFENIDIKISKLNDYDYQINNLVKFQSHKEVLKIKKEFSNALDNSKFVEDFEITNDL